MNIKRELQCYDNICMKLLFLEEQTQGLKEGVETEEVILLLNKINNEKKKYFIRKINIEKSIANLSDPLEREVLYNRYILGMKWDDIARVICYSKMTAHRIHNKALKNINLERVVIEEKEKK